MLGVALLLCCDSSMLALLFIQRAIQAQAKDELKRAAVRT
jgi:hypothetical protein